MEKKAKKSFELSSDSWVSKSNVLNEVRNNRMNITQIRFFTIYLSKINPKNINSREVTFKLEEYTKIMQFKKTNTTRLIKTAEDLLGLTVKFWDKTGQYSSDGLVGFVMCQIFKRFKLYKSDDGEWFVTIDCHDDVVKLMFELQKYYFKYQLWNALQLTSPNQQRMYEILKQYEYAGIREISVKDLREFLGIKPEEYTLWQNFKKRVLDASQEALGNYTDIKFKWEISGKRGKGGKINYLKFNIEKNENYLRQLSFDDYLIIQDDAEFEDILEEFERPDEVNEDNDSPYNNRIEFLAEACNNEFSKKEIIVLYDLMMDCLPYDVASSELKFYNYLKRKYDYMNMRNEKEPVKSRFGYIKSIIGKDEI